MTEHIKPCVEFQDWWNVSYVHRDLDLSAKILAREAFIAGMNTVNLYVTGEWQPIETAPMDGTEILLYKDIAPVSIVRNGRWVKKYDWSNQDEEMEGWWCYTNSVSQEMLDGVYSPTHWMPFRRP